MAAAGTAVALTGAAIGLLGSDHGSTTPTATAATAASCAVDYSVRSASGGRASTAVTIANTGAAPLTGWQLEFRLPGEQRLVKGWNNGWQQNGGTVAVRGAALPPGGRVATGFDATYRSVTGLPAEFLLNGVACRSALSVTGPSATPSPTPPTVRQPPAPAHVKAVKKAGKDKNKDKGKGKGKDSAKGGGKGKG